MPLTVLSVVLNPSSPSCRDSPCEYSDDIDDLSDDCEGVHDPIRGSLDSEVPHDLSSLGPLHCELWRTYLSA